MAPDFPPDPSGHRPVPAHVQEQCVNYAAAQYQIHPLVLHAIAEVEGGQIGMASRNANGTYDLGVMQINTINLPLIERHFPRVGWRELVWSPCVNIAIGAWFLRRKIDEVGGDFWRGVGNYHSATPRHHNRYKRLVHDTYQRLRAERMARAAN
ncbi:lytic transglycosylase domain-containing protein [Natronocella acetinitrilica]|nr:lytic transglycosylase domain-containing protein [Natronocella acetinitrilica]